MSNDIMTQLEDITFLSISVRLILAIILGGIVGIERGTRNHPAGFRTHVLVCVGACLAMMTNQYVFESISEATDPTRLGAQVITGVGFLGVGTILVTGRNKIKGLTTAAGLWASACMGLAVGIGFYTGAIMTGICILIVLAVFSKVENLLYDKSKNMDIYIEVDDIHRVQSLLETLKQAKIRTTDSTFSQDSPIAGSIGIHLSLRLPKRIEHDLIINSIVNREGVLLVEEI